MQTIRLSHARLPFLFPSFLWTRCPAQANMCFFFSSYQKKSPITHCVSSLHKKSMLYLVCQLFEERKEEVLSMVIWSFFFAHAHVIFMVFSLHCFYLNGRNVTSSLVDFFLSCGSFLFFHFCSFDRVREEKKLQNGFYAPFCTHIHLHDSPLFLFYSCK